MKHWYKYWILNVIIPISTLAFPQNIQAQQLNGVFIMSSVGGLNNMSSNSMAIAFNSSTTCFNVQNGAAAKSTLCDQVGVPTTIILSGSIFLMAVMTFSA